MTCDECLWKTEKNDCPWWFMYKDTSYAEDCIDFRCTKFPEEAFDEETNQSINALAIKGIKMPDNCHECDSLGISDLVGIKCPCNTDKCYSYDGRPDGCPLKEVKVN